MRGVGAAHRVAQGPDPAVHRPFGVDPDRGSPVTISRAFRHRRGPIEQLTDVTLNVVQLGRAHHVLKDEKSVPPVGLENLRIEMAIGVKPDRPTIAQCERPFSARRPVLDHGRFVGAIPDRGDIEKRELGHGETSKSHRPAFDAARRRS
jgi:hypothetical protein